MKSVNTTGQIIFITRQASIFSKIEANDVLIPFTILTALGSISVILICKAQAINKTFGPKPDTAIDVNVIENPEQAPLSLPGKFVYFSLSSCSLISGFLDGMYGFFGANIVSEMLVNKFPLNKALSEIIINLCSASGLGVSLACYWAYDYSTILKVNADVIARNLQLFFNTALLKTLLLGLPIAGFMAAQTIFTTGPALSTVPFLVNLLNPSLLKLLANLAGLNTALTVISFFPTIYNIVKPNDEPQQENVENNRLIVAENKSIKACRYTTYVAGTLDSLFNTGLGIFLAIIFSLNGSDPDNFDWTHTYRWIIAIAFFGGLYAAILNVATVRPGYLERIETMQNQEEETIQTVVEDAVLENEEITQSTTVENSGIYGSANQIGFFFKNVYTGIKRNIRPENNRLIEQEMDDFSHSDTP